MLKHTNKNKKKGTRSATTNFGKEEVLKIREGIILETLGPGGARVAFVNTIEETANAILSYMYIPICAYIEMGTRLNAT